MGASLLMTLVILSLRNGGKGIRTKIPKPLCGELLLAGGGGFCSFLSVSEARKAADDGRSRVV